MRFAEMANNLRCMEFFSDSLRGRDLKSGKEIIVAQALRLKPKDIKEMVCTGDVAYFASNDPDLEDYLVQYDIDKQTIVSYMRDDKIKLRKIINKIFKLKKLTDEEREFTEQNPVIDDFTSDLIISIADQRELGYYD